MTIGFYLSKIQPSDGGIYQYSIYVLRMLLKCNEINRIYIFYSLEQKDEFADYLNNQKVTAILHDKSSLIYTLLKRTSEYYLNRYYLRRMESERCHNIYKSLNPDRRFLNRFPLDLLYIPRQHSPAYKLNFPVVISMHDVQHFHFPEFFTPIERMYRAIRYFTSMNETDHVIVSYKHVKHDLNKYFREIKAGVSVCPVPINEDWVSGKPVTNVTTLIKKYNIPDNIILTPAATWEHKNHIAVLEALSILREEGIRIFWVSTGNKTGFYQVIEKRIAELNLKDQVLFTGVVPESDLVGFYKMAKLAVIPTLYEAGSGPLYEAMRYGTPVICSNVTSLPDTIGNDEFVFNPGNFRQIADFIKKALADEAFTGLNRENSAKRIQEINEANYTTAFLDAYNAAISTFRKSN